MLFYYFLQLILHIFFITYDGNRLTILFLDEFIFNVLIFYHIILQRFWFDLFGFNLF